MSSSLENEVPSEPEIYPCTALPNPSCFHISEVGHYFDGNNENFGDEGGAIILGSSIHLSTDVPVLADCTVCET